jgi:uncharacterized membrane protein YfcA
MSLDLSPLALAYCVLVLLATFTLRGSIGFGGAIGLPLFALVLPVKVIAPAWSLIGILSSVAILGRDRRHIARADFIRFLPGCAVGVAAGIVLFQAFDALLLARTLGVFVILYGLYSLWRIRHPQGAARWLPAPLLRVLGSFFSGAVGTLFGAMASIFFAMYMDGTGANKNQFRATLSAMLFVLSIARTFAYAAVGELTLQSWLLCGAALPFMGLGLLVGDRIHSGLSERTFQYVVCGSLIACGIPLLLK